MPVKRLRIFAGPNGSGKSTIISKLESQISLGVYVNADEIEKDLKKHKSISFKNYKLIVTTQQLQSYFKKSKLSPIKTNDKEYWKSITIQKNQLALNSKIIINSYLAADIAEFIRQNLLKKEISFSYETVMSHTEKINFLKKAKKKGYRIYLYFVATEDPSININRVNIRIKQKGHPVKSTTIIERYYKSLENLKPAIKQSNRAYLFDNSNDASILIAEITEGKSVSVFDPEKAPNWFKKYVVE